MNIKKFILLLLFLSLPTGLLGLDKEPKQKKAKVEDNKDKITFAKKVRDIIKSGGNLNVCDENDAVPLLVRAMYNKDIDLFREMLQTNNIDVDYPFIRNYIHTPLIETCCSDDDKSEFIQLLLDHGADINQKGPARMTLLMLTAGESNKDNLKILLKNKVNININDTALYGETALMCAFHGSLPSSDYELIQILLSHGADPNMQNKKGLTALMFLAKSPLYNIDEEEKLAKIARLLIFSGADPEIRNGNGRTFLDYTTKESFRKKLENICKEYKNYLKQCLKSSDTYNITHLPNPISDIVADYVL